jgi:excisionase family DNA binding protein
VIVNIDRPLVVKTTVAARMLGISPRTVERLVARGELPTTRIGRATRLSVAVLEAYVRENTTCGGSETRSAPVMRSAAETAAPVDDLAPSPLRRGALVRPSRRLSRPG